MIHIETSLDAESGDKRKEKFEKKFQHGRKYIYEYIFPWVKEEDTPLEQKVILVSSRIRCFGGGKVVTIDEFIKEIADKIYEGKVAAKGAIPEEFDLLRTIQFVIRGYNRTLSIYKTNQHEKTTA